MKNIYSELQEVVFWQQLNRQLISLRSKSQNIGDEQQDFLQKFLFDHMVFSKVTSADLLFDVPLALITDFGGVCFINLKNERWNDCLRRLIRNSFVLDMEQALADSYGAMEGYERKFGFKRETEVKDEDDEDDEGLYEFMETYLRYLEGREWDLREILSKLYRMKAEFMEVILKLRDYEDFLTVRNDVLMFDLSTANEKEKVEMVRSIEKPFMEYLSRAYDLVHRLFFGFFDINIESLFTEKLAEKNLKPSIKQFAEHELVIFKNEAQLLRDFEIIVGKKIDEKKFSEVNICSLSPFYFLKNPLPLV